MDWTLVHKALSHLHDAGVTTGVDEETGEVRVTLDGRTVTYVLGDGAYTDTGAYRVGMERNVPLDRWLLVFPKLTRKGQAELQANRQNFLDGVGNGWLHAEGFVIRLVGKTVRPVMARSGFNAAECKVVLAFLTAPSLRDAPIRSLAAWSGVSIQTVSRTLGRLESKGYLHRSGATTQARRDWERLGDLLDEWCTAYEQVLHSKLRTPARFRTRDGRPWRALDLEPIRGQWGESAAADLLGAGMLQAASPLLYTSARRSELAVQAGLIPDANGEIEVGKRFWGDVEMSGTLAGSRSVAPLPLVIADLWALHDARAEVAYRDLKHVWKTQQDLP